MAPNSPAAQNCPPGMMPDMCTDRNSADRSLQTSAVTVPTALSAGRSLRKPVRPSAARSPALLPVRYSDFALRTAARRNMDRI